MNTYVKYVCTFFNGLNDEIQTIIKWRKVLIDQLFNIEKRLITEIANLLKHNNAAISRELFN